MMELINVADPEKSFPKKVPEAARGGKPFASTTESRLKTNRHPRILQGSNYSPPDVSGNARIPAARSPSGYGLNVSLTNRLHRKATAAAARKK